MMFGMYAKFFKEQNPKEGEFLTLVNPHCCVNWQFPGDENSGIFLKLEIGPKLAAKVCLHPELPVIQKEVPEKPPEFVQQISMSPKTNKKRNTAIPEKKKQKLVYTPLKDCAPSKSIKYNTWGVVKKINFFPRPTRRGGLFSSFIFSPSL